MGDVTPKDDSFEQVTMRDNNNKPVSVVKMIFKLKHPAVDHLYDYLRNANSDNNTS